MDKLMLVQPTEHYAGQVMAYRREMLDNHDSLDGCAGLEDTESFAEWVDFENRLKKRYGENCTPSSVYLAVRVSDDCLVGIIDFRHRLSEFLFQYGGHIGYSVRSTERRKGYASQMLHLVLEKCREHGLSKVLVTCDKENEASRRTIVRNGGVLENEVAVSGIMDIYGYVQRFWITL